MSVFYKLTDSKYQFHSIAKPDDTRSAGMFLLRPTLRGPRGARCDQKTASLPIYKPTDTPSGELCSHPPNFFPRSNWTSMNRCLSEHFCFVFRDVSTTTALFPDVAKTSIRAVVTESTCRKVTNGSLYVFTCMGGSIGRGNKTFYSLGHPHPTGYHGGGCYCTVLKTQLLYQV